MMISFLKDMRFGNKDTISKAKFEFFELNTNPDQSISRRDVR
jgi:hypothetical protein